MTRRLLTLAALALVPVAVLGVFFVLPVVGMVARGLLAGRHVRPRQASLEVLGRRAGAPGAVVHALVRLRRYGALRRCSACPRRTPCTGWTSRAAGWCAPLLLVPFVLPTVVVGRGLPPAARARAGRWGSSASTRPRLAVVAGLVFFNVAVVVRAVGASWESLDPRPAQAAATLGATPWQVLRTVTLPALRPAIVSAASVVFLFCATAFGIVLTLGGVRNATVETEIYLLTTSVFDLQAAAALSVLQLLVVVGLLLGLAQRLRAVPGPQRRPGRRRGRGGPGRGDAARAADDRRWCWPVVAVPIAHPRHRVAPGRRRVEPRRTTAP